MDDEDDNDDKDDNHDNGNNENVLNTEDDDDSWLTVKRKSLSTSMVPAPVSVGDCRHRRSSGFSFSLERGTEVKTTARDRGWLDEAGHGSLRGGQYIIQYCVDFSVRCYLLRAERGMLLIA